jgi:phospholipid-translocating ATPase
LDNRNEEIKQVVSRYLEKGVELLGLTGVEDKLQDDVKVTFELLRNAGLKIWMLTGDKIETAKCISISSRLIIRSQPIHIISQRKFSNLISLVISPDLVMEQLDIIATQTDCCLIIDGDSLQIMLDHYPKEFIQIADRLSVVVCCRCSPTQKAEVVRLIKLYTGKRTCAIGDGGNDVSMIQMAHVGIGIVGKEGMQASLAADFSITQFSFISKLLLWHGRNSYKRYQFLIIRSAKLAHFVIHRGLIISVMQAVFSSLFYYAPIALFQGFILVGYTTIYTVIISIIVDGPSILTSL